MGSDAREAESIGTTEINHEHGKVIINEANASNDAARTSIDESRTVISMFIRNLRARSHGLISYFIKGDHKITTSEAQFEVVEATKASSSKNCSLPEDGIHKGTHSDIEDRKHNMHNA